MTPRQVATRVAEEGRLRVLPDDMRGKHLLQTAGLGLIRWDETVAPKDRAWVLTDAGREAVGDVKPRKRAPKRSKASADWADIDF